MRARDHATGLKGQMSQMAPPRRNQRSAPTTGDVLISRSTARADVYAISTVPLSPTWSPPVTRTQC